MSTMTVERWNRLPHLVRYTLICLGLGVGIFLFFASIFLVLDWYTSNPDPSPTPHGPSTETY